MDSYLLSLIVFLPLLAMVVLLAIRDSHGSLVKIISLATNALQLILCCFLAFTFNHKVSGMEQGFQFLEKYNWISLEISNAIRFNADYHVGVDGLSMPLVVLTSLLMLIGLISSWNQSKQTKGYFVLYNLLNTSIIGCFVALDFFLFYLFFELMLLPMFFLIGIWGGPNRSYASVKFFLYTLFGSVLILIVMIGLYLGVTSPGTSVQTFNILHMMDVANYGGDAILNPSVNSLIFGVPARYLAFLALFIGFAIKLPAVPVHTWLPDAHVEAPTAISVILAGLLLKVGGYGIFRIAFGIFPDGAARFAFVVAVFGILSIVYGGLNALAQRDLKRMVAYSSVSHMGFVLVGFASLTVEGISGSFFHMISHGLISGALFLIAGVIYDRTGDRLISNYSGLAARLPKYTFVTVIIFFASLGLPGLSGFVGELLVFIGAFAAPAETGVIPSWIGYVAITGIIISATYPLWTLQRMFFGKYWVRESVWQDAMFDLDRRELLMFTPIILVIVALGVYPKLLLSQMQATVEFFANYLSP